MRTPSTDRIRLMVMTTVPETLGAFFERQLMVLAENGFEVHAVSAPGTRLDRINQLPGVTAHGVEMLRQPHPVRDLVSLIRLIRLMRRVRPHIVHANTPKAGLLGMAAAWTAGVPVRLYGYLGLPLLTRGGIWRRVLEAAERASCRFATRIYSISASLRERLLELNLCPEEKVSVVGDGSIGGVDLERFNPGADWTARSACLRRTYGIPPEARLITCVGRIARDKGVAILASAWSELARQFPDLHLLLVGGEDATDPVPGSALNLLRNHERVHITGGFIDDVETAYATTAVCVLPTFREGICYAALEAGAMGVPVVGSCIPGLVDSVRDGVTGLLVPPGEVAPFVDALRRLLEDPALSAAMGRAGRAHIAPRYSEQRVNQLWISEYRKLIRESLPGFSEPAARIENQI